MVGKFPPVRGRRSVAAGRRNQAERPRLIRPRMDQSSRPALPTPPDARPGASTSTTGRPTRPRRPGVELAIASEEVGIESPRHAAVSTGEDAAESLLHRAVGILGLGAYVPETVVPNSRLATDLGIDETWIVERTGIEERRRVGSGETASTMGTAAARRALEAAGTDASEIDLLVLTTVTPDTLFPATACHVQRELGMGTIPAFDLNAACSGFVYSLVVAEAAVRAGRARRVLVVASEALTTVVDYQDRTTCVLFGDGAGAAVVGPVEAGGIRAARWRADGREAGLIHYGYAEGDDGRPALRMAGRGTFRLAVERLVELAHGLCADAGWRIEDVAWMVPHQANRRIVAAAAERLGLGWDRVLFNGDRLGNTGAASIPLVLAEAAADGRLRPGDRTLCLAFGAGATWAGVALEWSSG